MSDDFGTINVSRAERAREIEVMRQQYRRQREMLQQLIADAPTEHLASEYRRLIADIDGSLVKLDEMDGRPSGAFERPRPQAPRTEAGTRPLAMTPAYEVPPADTRRLILIVGAALAALAILAGLYWFATRDGEPEETVVESTAETTGTSGTVTDEGPVTPAPAPAAPAAALAALPETIDFGEVRKGTRAVRQLEVLNNGEQPLTVDVARSACRCLYYAHAPVVPPKAKETLTVTIDGARAARGELRETIKVSAKSDASVATTFDVTATVR
jgi:Protein of unknown function (DUF1573)